MAAGRFRKDFYYRLCSDIIATPSLASSSRDSPRRAAEPRAVHRPAGGGRRRGRERWREEIERWIDAHLGDGYRWPGNFRELEQCVRNVLIRREYRPPHAGAGVRPAARRRRDAGRLAERRGAAAPLLHARVRRDRQLPGNRAAASGSTGGTVKDKIDPDLLTQLGDQAPVAR